MAAHSVETRKTVPQPNAVVAQSAVKTHLLYIDNLRTTLIAFVILLHMAITYSAEGDWYYHEPGNMSIVVTVITVFIAAIGSGFVLGLFFMLAGYFTPHSYDKRGFGGFLVDRAKRLLIPLALYEAIIFPLIRYIVRVKEGFQG